MHCYGCGLEIDEFAWNHKCDALREKQIEDSRKASYDQIHSRRDLTYNQRLNLGFDLLDPDFWN